MQEQSTGSVPTILDGNSSNEAYSTMVGELKTRLANNETNPEQSILVLNNETQSESQMILSKSEAIVNSTSISKQSSIENEFQEEFKGDQTLVLDSAKASTKYSAEANKVIKLFKEIDKNNSGKISRSELIVRLRKMPKSGNFFSLFFHTI